MSPPDPTPPKAPDVRNPVSLTLPEDLLRTARAAATRNYLPLDTLVELALKQYLQGR